MGNLTVKNVDDALKRDFKIACLRNDYTMSEVLIRFMHEYVRDNTPEGLSRTSGNSRKDG